MANHDWNAMAVSGSLSALAPPAGATSAAVLVEAGQAWHAGGCGAAGGFGSGALLALPVLVVAVMLRRRSRR